MAPNTHRGLLGCMVVELQEFIKVSGRRALQFSYTVRTRRNDLDDQHVAYSNDETQFKGETSAL